MSAEVDLIWVGAGKPPRWPLGRTIRAAAQPAALADGIARELPQSRAAAWLFWGPHAGAPDPERVAAILERPGDVWHSGLNLGMNGLPAAIDHVAPTWMLNCDPDPSREATSWRLSLEACLVRTEVLRALGGVRPQFETLAGAACELGHRWIVRGALLRHVPSLAPEARKPEEGISLEDEMRFVLHRFGRFWLRWSLFRAVLAGEAGLGRARRIRRLLSREEIPAEPPALRPTDSSPVSGPSGGGRVTVLIPTVDRYPYLDKLLEQLREQTVKAFEIIIVDQTARERRQTDLAARFTDLPLRVFVLDQAGQCSSRNAGLEASRGDYILFVDDDDEVPPDLIERHLESLARFRSEASCGVAEEVGAGPLPDGFRTIRTSDVFPTNNTLLLKSALGRSGLFDLAYDRGARADGDLGMRLYLGGTLMVLNPEITLLHHHAPSGGLRIHKARVRTYASSRQRISDRHLPARTEIYLARRYFNPRQVREMIWLYAAGTFAIRGSRWRKLAKGALSLALLPHSLSIMRSRWKQVDAMMGSFPKIPPLTDARTSPDVRP